MLGFLEWRVPSAEFVLRENELHVWQACLELDREICRNFEATLSKEEKARAQKFRFESDRKHFVAARGILRHLLSHYLNESAAAIEFSYGQQGKPTVRLQHYASQLHFNVSHSHGLALFALGCTGEIGIDVEAIRPGFDLEDIAGRFFSPREIAEFRALPTGLRAEGFFRCWTRKEAYIKAKGAGLQIPLDSFSVSLTPGQPERLQCTDSFRWTLHSLEPAPGFVAAVVAEGQDWKLHPLMWQC